MFLSEIDGASLRVGSLSPELLRFRAELDQPDVWSGPGVEGSERGLGLTLSGVAKSYGTRQVLDGIDLRIEPGEFVAIVGRSGCGKSTLLRLLAGLESASQGTILGDEQPLEQHREEIRMMFQDARLLPWKRVVDNIALGLEPVRGPLRAREALAQVGLSDRAREWPAVLSGGQRQRVALARALVHTPRLLLLDEPLGALDALTRIEMQRLIESLWREHGFTALLVTHDVAEAIALADRVLLIEYGRIALDERIRLPRPRSRGHAEFAALEERVLERVLQTQD
jgi:sulfonate transport system ATP-binding protein